MNKPSNVLNALWCTCLICLAGAGIPTKVLAVSTLPTALTVKNRPTLKERLAYRILQKCLLRTAASTDKPCAVLLKKDGTEVFVKIISRGSSTLRYYLCDDPTKRLKHIDYDSISAVRLANNSLWKPYGTREPKQIEGGGYLGASSLALSVVGLLTLALGIGFIICIAGVIVGIIGLHRGTKRRWAAILGVVLGAIPILLVLLFVALSALFLGD